MQFQLTKDQIKELVANGISHPTVTTEHWGGTTQFSSHTVSADYLDKLHKYALKHSIEFNGVLQKLSVYAKVLKNPKGSTTRRLDALQAAIEQACIVQAPNRWLFKGDSEVPEPYLVTKVEYSPADAAKEEPADVTVFMSYSAKGEIGSRHITFHMPDLDGRTVEELLLGEGFIMETPALIEQYNAYLLDWEAKYKAHCQQFLYETDRLPSAARHSSRERRNEATNLQMVFKVVNDVPILKLNALETTKRVPSLTRGQKGDGSDNDATDVFTVPIHPWVFCFNLETHEHMWIEPHKMTAYVYERNLVDKLILPKAHKTLIRTLTTNPDVMRTDVVRGKSGGTIIMACGDPGTGKTLSAEAYAEGCGIILYRIQSDQLGTSPDEIEKNLKDVFARTERWKAVLLIDECDIYVRERGTDIDQNAIVGTILRTLEYFNGIMFMTTNIQTAIDDAIMSRCSAVIEYQYPALDDATTIFDQYAKLFEMQVSAEVVRDFLTKAGCTAAKGKLSGRSIKNILRLTARRGFLTPPLEELQESRLFIR